MDYNDLYNLLYADLSWAIEKDIYNQVGLGFKWSQFELLFNDFSRIQAAFRAILSEELEKL